MSRSEYQLVCEGRCNPHRPLLDEQVEEVRRLITPGAQAHEHITQMLHTLIHTAHQRVGPGRYACAVCQTVRRYGSL